MRTPTTFRSRQVLRRIVDHRDEGPTKRADQLLLRNLVRQGIGLLRVRSQEVLRLRYGLDGCSHTLDETARILRLGREYVRQVEVCGLSRLRHIFKGYAIRNLDEWYDE